MRDELSPKIKLRTPTQSGTQKSPRGSLIDIDELISALESMEGEEAILFEELKAQADFRKNAPNRYPQKNL